MMASDLPFRLEALRDRLIVHAGADQLEGPPAAKTGEICSASHTCPMPAFAELGHQPEAFAEDFVPATRRRRLPVHRARRRARTIPETRRAFGRFRRAAIELPRANPARRHIRHPKMRRAAPAPRATAWWRSSFSRCQRGIAHGNAARLISRCNQIRAVAQSLSTVATEISSTCAISGADNPPKTSSVRFALSIIRSASTPPRHRPTPRAPHPRQR